MDLEYSLIGPVTPRQANRIIRIIGMSKKVEIANELPDGRIDHIVVKDTKIPVGIMGTDTFNLVNIKDDSLKPYHTFLREIYGRITRFYT
jgi:hypothetical protein